MADPNVGITPYAVRWSTAAKLLDCSEKKVRLLEKAGRLSTIKVGADRRVTIESIQRFVANGGDRPSTEGARR